jgi:hypothetical protein
VPGIPLRVMYLIRTARTSTSQMMILIPCRFSRNCYPNFERVDVLIVSHRLGTGHALLGARNIYSLVGNAVSYVCNANGGKSVIVTAAERKMAFNMITAACGQNAGGWTHEDHVGIANVQWGMEGISLGGDNFCNIGLN